MPHDFQPRDGEGRPIDYEQHLAHVARETEQAANDAPRDCVTEVALHGGRTMLLISYDPEGQPGPTSTFPAGEVNDGDVIYLLERCRAIYRKTHPRHLRAV